jgi:hypothetical protein
MSEPFERLIRFTPDAGRLERDALLFAAGRASARPNRGWMTLAALLASTQVLSLVLLWPPAAPPGPGSPAPVAGAPALPATVERARPQPSADPGLWSARPQLLEAEPEKQPDTGTFIDNGPPLRAFGSPPSSILN